MTRFHSRLSMALLAVTLSGGVATAEPAIERSVKLSSPGIYEIIVNPAEDVLYVAAPGGRGSTTGVILILDPKTLEQKGSIDVSEAPAYGLGFNHKTQTLYTTNTRQNSVSVIDVASGKVVNTIAADEGVMAHGRQVIVDEEANVVYVSMFGGRGGQTGKVWVIDGATNALAEVIDDVGLGVTGLALDKEGNRLFATDMTANQVVVIDLEKKRVSDRWYTGGKSSINVAYDAGSKRLFVANQGSGDVSVLRAEDGEILDTIETGEGALGITFNPADKRLYVTNRRAGTTSVIDSVNGQILAQLETGSHPQTVAVDPRTNIAYVTNKVRSAGRGQPPVEDPNGGTVSIVTP